MHVCHRSPQKKRLRFRLLWHDIQKPSRNALLCAIQSHNFVAGVPSALCFCRFTSHARVPDLGALAFPRRFAFADSLHTPVCPIGGSGLPSALCFCRLTSHTRVPDLGALAFPRRDYFPQTSRRISSSNKTSARVESLNLTTTPMPNFECLMTSPTTGLMRME